tara:strand:+ start:248 stop:580 length:333 start_codon:yes stop_codon:yes gene_type:complete
MSEINLQEGSKVSLDIKTLVGIVAMILSIAGVYFTLTGQIAQLQLAVVRLQDSELMNTEFRIKWPRGELGALPDDAKQDLRIEYLRTDLKKLSASIDDLQKELEVHKTED